MTSKWVAWDLEVAKPFPPDGEWRNVRPLGISCASTLTSSGEERLWYSQRAAGDRLFPEEARNLVRYLHQLASDGYVVVTWNGLQFDFDVLAEECDSYKWSLVCADMAMAHIDMAFQMLCEKGYMAGLEKIAEGLGGEGKTEGMHGDLAPLLWNGCEGAQEEQSERIRAMGIVPRSKAARDLCLDYVLQDSKITGDVYEGLLQQGSVRWKGKSGKLVKAPGWEPRMVGRMLTVDECLALPKPSMSWWPDCPFTREACYEWVDEVRDEEGSWGSEEPDPDLGAEIILKVVASDDPSDAIAEAFDVLAVADAEAQKGLPMEGEKMEGEFRTLRGYTIEQVIEKLGAKLEDAAYAPVPGAANLTDIKPAWLWAAMTDVFGLCGQGWWFTCGPVDVQYDGEANKFQCYAAVVEDFELFYAYTEGGERRVSMGIPGIGAAEMGKPGYARRGAKTNALGDAAKMLLWQLDVYQNKLDAPEGDNSRAPSRPQGGGQSSGPNRSQGGGAGDEFVESADPADWGDVGEVKPGDVDQVVKGGKHDGKTLGQLRDGDKKEQWYLRNWIAKGWSYGPLREAARRLVVAGLGAEGAEGDEGDAPVEDNGTLAEPSKKRTIQKYFKELGAAEDDVDRQLKIKGYPKLDELTKVQATALILKLYAAVEAKKKGGQPPLPPAPPPEEDETPF